MSARQRTLVIVATLVLAAVFAASARAQAMPALEPVDGGADYYSRFASPLPVAPTFFPIGVWGAYDLSAVNLGKDKSAGLNLYVWIADPPSANLPGVRAAGMHAILPADDRGQYHDIGPETVGWLLSDEIDMRQADEEGAAAARSELAAMRAFLPADGRAAYNNYGKGVAFWNTDDDAARFVNDYQEFVSADVYWHTDPGGACSQSEGGTILGGLRPLTDAECRRSANYGWTVTRLRQLDALDGSRKPIWNFVELGCPFSDGDCITAPQVRAAVWQSIIAGARGIVYFNHSFGGSCKTQNVLRDGCYGAVRQTVTKVDAQIHQLAPVLNAPTVASGWSHDTGTTALVKWADGHFYVLAGSAGTATTGRFSIPCAGNAAATVIGEDRSVPVQGGTFEDAFADPNAIHLYRIDGGSTCGLHVEPAPPGSGAVPPPGGSATVTSKIGRLAHRVSLRGRRLRVPITCAAPCRARARLTIGRAGHRVRLAAARRRFTAGAHKLTLRLTRRDARRVAGGRAMRLRTTVTLPGRELTRTQRLVARRR